MRMISYLLNDGSVVKSYAEAQDKIAKVLLTELKTKSTLTSPKREKMLAEHGYVSHKLLNRI